MTKPLSPDEIGLYKSKTFPPEVFEAFNELIAAKFSNGYATVKQEDVVERIISKIDKDHDPEDLPTRTRSRIFAEGWLNVEEAYREQGWKVEYDKPGYNESYGAYFTFRSK